MKSNKLDFTNKLILAPMVRIGTLPMRLLSLDYGADIVFTEELIDWKLLKSIRRQNTVLETVDFIDKSDGTIIFRTCSKEKQRVVVQLGTCDAERALKVAKMIENDVAGIDINMGCPKEFSLKGGMGAALLSQPEKAKDILKTLVENINLPITCKIRVFENPKDTLDLVKELVSTGISAITIHGRTKQERPRHFNRNDTIKFIANNISIPVIANGGSKEIDRYSDIGKFKEACGSSSVMIARAAEENCSIFRPNGRLDIDTIIIDYLKYAIDYDNSPSNTKYCIQNILKELQETPRGKKFLECQTLEQISSIWNLGNYCKNKLKEYHLKGNLSRCEITPDMFEPLSKKSKIISNNDDDDCLYEMKCVYLRVNYENDFDLPKTKIVDYCNRNKFNLPIYETINRDKLFKCIVHFQGKKFSSTYWEKNKRFAQQGAALVLALYLGLYNKDDLINNGSLLL